jgi:hypothetical protein
LTTLLRESAQDFVRTQFLRSMADEPAPEPEPRTTAGPDDPAQSSEERIQWLRDHGVTVEIPEDRKNAPPAGGAELNKEMVDRAHEKAQAILAEREAAAPRKRFAYVRIPADESQPYEELEAEVPAAGDQLLNVLKPAFSSGGSVSDDALRKQFGGTPAANVSASALNEAAAGGSVEAFPLVRPSDANGQEAINLYLDEVGALKKLSLNSRGCALAATCGFVDVPLYGDLYIGRVQGRVNQDFRISEMASDASWMSGAVAANLEHSQAMSKFNEDMGGAGGMTAVDTENAGPMRTEDDGTKGYSWEQNEEDLDVEVTLPPGLTAKHLTVKILPRKIAVSWPAVGVAKEGEMALSLFGN